MADTHADEGNGRIKEAAGSLNGDDASRTRARQADQAKASVKDTVDKAKDLSGS